MAIYRGKGWQESVSPPDGERIRRTFKTKEEAEAWKLEAQAAIKLGKPVPMPTTGEVKNAKVFTLEQLVDHVFKVHWRSKKAGEHLVKIAELFRDWAGPKAPVAAVLTHEKVHEYVLWRISEKRNSGSTVNRHLSAVSKLAEYARLLKLIPERLEMPWQPEAEGRLRFFSKDEVAEIDRVCRHWNYEAEADLFLFLADTGMRLGEALTLEWRDIREDAITIAAEHSKTKVSRTIGIPPRVKGLLEGRKVFQEGPWRNISRRRLRLLWDRLRAFFPWMGPDTVIHTYRHTCASRLILKYDLHTVGTWLGHKAEATTKRYAHLAPDRMKEVAAALVD